MKKVCFLKDITIQGIFDINKGDVLCYEEKDNCFIITLPNKI